MLPVEPVTGQYMNEYRCEKSQLIFFGLTNWPNTVAPIAVRLWLRMVSSEQSGVIFDFICAGLAPSASAVEED
jgi:hypothetical protein